MINLLPSLLFLTAAFSPNITYEIITDEFYQHNTYSYHGTIVIDTPEYIIYKLNSLACDTKESLVYHNIIDETVFFNDRTPRKSFFTLQKDHNDHCLLTIKKRIYKNNMHYNRDYDYWYPDYNHIDIVPRHKVIVSRPKRHHRHRKIMARHLQKPKPKIVLPQRPKIKSKPKVIIIKKVKYKKRKRHHKK